MKKSDYEFTPTKISVIGNAKKLEVMHLVSELWRELLPTIEEPVKDDLDLFRRSFPDMVTQDYYNKLVYFKGTANVLNILKEMIDKYTDSIDTCGTWELLNDANDTAVPYLQMVVAVIDVTDTLSDDPEEIFRKMLSSELLFFKDDINFLGFRLKIELELFQEVQVQLTFHRIYD